MKGKTLNKKAIITIVIIAILLIATISMVVVFLKDQGETEATAIAENNSNGQETQTSVQEDNNNQGTEQQNTEEQDTEPVEDNEPIDDNNNAQVNNNQAQITTTPDSTTTITEETVTVPTEEVNLGWSNITVSGGEQLTNVYALNPEIVSNLEVNKTEVLNQKAKLEYVLNISNNSTDIDAKAIIVTMEVPEGTKFVEAKDAKKEQALNDAIKQIEKQFGKGSVMKLGEFKAMEIEAIPTGALSLDIALGIGGVPRGRIIEVFGPESSGKTTLALHIVAEAQKMGGEAAFIDAEHALDPVYAKKLGVDIDNLIVSQPDTGEQALEITESLVRSGALDVIVVDSVAALVPKAEIDGDMGDSHMGLQARLMSQALRKLAGAINKSKTVLIFINQLREKIGVMFGNPETTTGGRALKFYASVRMDIRRIENIKQDGEITGTRAKVKVVKNKVAPPFREAEFDIVYGKGISREGNILDMAVNLDIVEKAGSWFSYNGERIGQGRENVKKYLKENPEMLEDIEEKVRENFAKAFEQSLGEDLPSKEDEEE